MRTFSTSPDFRLLQYSLFLPIPVTSCTYSLPFSNLAISASPRLFLSNYILKPTCLSSSSNKDADLWEEDSDDDDYSSDPDAKSVSDDGIEITIVKLEDNSRKIESRVAVDATLEAVWSILTDYEKLADFIPGLAVSQLMEKKDNFARLFQIGRQNLPFGLQFNAKGVVDCYERDLVSLPCGQRRDIDFEMIEGDFQIFEGKWSIEQHNNKTFEDCDSMLGQDSRSTLSYIVVVKPKMWLPVQLVEGRLCNEIKVNLSCIRDKAQKAIE